jgi:hypothetical protein
VIKLLLLSVTGAFFTTASRKRKRRQKTILRFLFTEKQVLLNMEKTQYAFGRITERTVLCNGESFEEENGIRYQNIQEYLMSL